MTLNEAIETLSAIGYPAKGNDWEEVIADLQSTHGSVRVGSSMNNLGNAAPLFIRSGNVAHMVDHPDDLRRSCIAIKNILAQGTALNPVTIKREVRSRWLPDICEALEHEISMAFRVKRELGSVDTDYQVLYDTDTRTQTRKPAQIMDDLLSDDKKRNAKAVEALKSILII